MKPKCDCFAFVLDNGVERCGALTWLVCRKEKCSFYKTAKQLEEQEIKTEKRLAQKYGQ